MGLNVEVKGGWRINTFFFLLTGSQAVVLPWIPVILKSTDLAAPNVGIVMGVITLAGSFGVHGCLAAMRRTHSGAARRLLLLICTLLSSVLYAIAVLLLPASAGGNGCSSSVIAKPHLPVNVDSEFSLHTTDAVLNGINLSTHENNNNSRTKENSHPTLPKPSNAIKNSSVAEKNTVTLPAFNHNHSTTSKNSDSTSTTLSSTTVRVKTTSTTVDGHIATMPKVPLKEKSKYPEVNQITSSAIKINVSSGTHKDTTSQKLSASNVPLSGLQSNIPSSDTTSTLVKQDSQHSSSDKITLSSKSAAGKASTSSSTDDLYYYYDYDEDSEYKAKMDDKSSSIRKVFPKHKMQHSFKTYEDIPIEQKPELSQVVPLKGNHVTGDRKSSFNGYDDGFQLQREKTRGNWRNAYFQSDLTSNEEPRKTLYLHDQKPSHLQSAQHRNSENLRYDSRRNGYHSQNIVVHKPYRKPPGSYGRQNERAKRSVNSFYTATRVDRNSRNLTSSDKAYTRNLAINIESPIGIQTGVAILMILGTLLSAGIETGVAQLWHCYIHGYDEGGVSQDILHRTITHTFQLSIYPAHKIWSGLTSGAWVIGGGTIAVLVCLMNVNSGMYSILSGVQLALGSCAVFMVLVIPIPYGSVDPPKIRRPLSLYLDDEVLREGIRRLAFHIWVLASGCVSALSLTFGLWLILELMGEQGHAIAAQTGAVSVSLATESLTLCMQKWLMARVGLQGIMGISGLALMTHLMIMWACGNVVLVIISFSGVGICSALLWVSVRHNALLLATVNDQERESWASWWCWRIGIGGGAIVWGSCVNATTSLSLLFKPAAFIAASIAAVIALTAVMTRRQGKTRRRIYHTLDLDMAADDDEDDEDDASEDDWLVKRAKKEGLSL